MFAKAAHHRKARQHLQRGRSAGCVGELRAVDQLFIDLLLFGDAQAIGHLDEIDAVDEGLVVFIRLEAVPFGLVGMGEDDAIEGNGADVFRADIVTLLRRGQQGVQHLDRRLEHFDKFEKPLIGAVQAARIAVGVGVVLGEVFEFANIHLADEGGDVLVVFIPRLGLGDADLAQARGHQLDDAEFRQIAASFIEALETPGAHQSRELAAGDVEARLQLLAHGHGIEEAQRTFEDGADLPASLQRIDGLLLHELLQPLRQRRLAAPHGAQQIKDLLALLEPLRRMAEIGDDALHRILHPVEFLEGGIDADGAVHEDAAKARVLRGVDPHGLADGAQQALGGACVKVGVAFASLKKIRDRHFCVAARLIRTRVAGQKIGSERHVGSWRIE